MNSAAALIPVILLILCGWGIAKLGWISQEHTAGVANLVFLVLLPALMFRSMAQVHFADVDYFPIFIYLGVAEFVFLCVAFALKWTPRSYVIGLSCIFSNHMMVGVPLVTLAYGSQALVTLITLVTIHALVLLGLATVFLEWRVARDEAAQKASGEVKSLSSFKSIYRVLKKTIYRAIVHPIILPIIGGLLWSLTGWKLPQAIDTVLAMLGQANGPVSLILVGTMLAYTRVNKNLLRRSMVIGLVKNLVFPVLVFAACWLGGVRGMPLAVLTVCAALPIGNNVYLFSMRYRQEEELITASVALTTFASIFTLAMVMIMLDVWVL